MTVFQTHLLAYNNQLKINYNAKRDVAERKFLVLVEQGGKRFAVIYRIKGYYLYDAAKIVFELLESNPTYRIKSMINLDTGLQNVLDLHQSVSYCNDEEIKGFVYPEYAMNLLVFYLK